MEIIQHLNKIKNRIGLVGGPLKLNILDEAEHNISVCISPTDWHIEMNVKKDWNPVPDRQTRAYAKKKNIREPLKRVLEDVLIHECGHWELPRGSGFGCPGMQGSVNYHDIILDNVTKALNKSKKGDQIVSSGQTLSHYIANSFEDIIDNLNCKKNTTHTGQVLFFNDQGLSHDGKYTKMYEAFVKLNMFLWGDSIDERLLKRFYTNDKDVIEAVQKVIKKLNFAKGEEAFDINHKKLFKKEDWGEMAYEYTKIILPLIEDQMPEEQLFGVFQEATAADKQLDQPKEKKKIVLGRYERSEGISSYMNSFEYLHTLYQQLAKVIPIEVDTPSISMRFPVTNYGKEAFDPLEHSSDQVLSSTVGFDEEGMHLVAAPHNLYVKRGVRRIARGFPKCKTIFLDTSESTKWSIDGSSNTGKIINPFAPANLQWGDRSVYHYELLGLYGMEAYFVQQGIAQEVDSALLNVSSKTKYTGVLEYARISEFFKNALTPQFGGTSPEIDVLEKAFAEENAFYLSLSDGEINNWDDIKDRYRKMIDGKMYVHIQVGKATDFSENIKSWGFPVYPVNKDDDLSKLMVSVTSSHYSSTLKEIMVR